MTERFEQRLSADSVNLLDLLCQLSLAAGGANAKVDIRLYFPFFGRETKQAPCLTYERQTSVIPESRSGPPRYLPS